MHAVVIAKLCVSLLSIRLFIAAGLVLLHTVKDLIISCFAAAALWIETQHLGARLPRFGVGQPCPRNALPVSQPSTAVT
jgi:hypothetical protein